MQPDVVTKYKAAAEITNSKNDFSLLTDGCFAFSSCLCQDCNLLLVLAEAIAAVVELCKDGAKIVDVCSTGDAVIAK